MPRAVPPKPGRIVPPQGGSGTGKPKAPDPVAVAHRQSDAPALGKWVESFVGLLPAEPTKSDVTNLNAIGAGMSVWQRDTLLAILIKYCT